MNSMGIVAKQQHQGSFGGMSPAQGHMHHGAPLTPMMDSRPPLTPVTMGGQPGSSGTNNQQLVPQQSGTPGGSISLSLLIDFIIQRTYHELSILSELLPRKTDMERKQEIFNFSARTRLLAVRLLGLVKWASSAAKVDKSVHIMNFLEKQSLLFVDTADCLARMARETLVHARLPNFHIPAAVEVLTTGTYSRLPTCIRDRIVPPDPITTIEKKTTLTRLNQVIQHRLVTTELPPQMRNLKIEHGRVVFRVENEFQVSLTVLGDDPNTPWKIIDIDILVDDKEIGDGMSLVHPLQIGFIHQLSQARLDSSQAPLKEFYDILHSFAQSLQLEVLYSQVLKLCRERLGDALSIEDYSLGSSLLLGYWRELSSLDPKAELGYRLLISVNHSDSSQPLSVTHQPPLPADETAATEEGLKTNQLEKILVHTIYLRSRNRLQDLKKELEMHLKIESTLAGSPPVLSIPLLNPCLRSEQLLVTVNIHSGSFMAHIPQFDPSPSVVTDIQNLLNTPQLDSTKLKTLTSQLRYWITERRCEKTLQHLPASAADRILLLKWDNDPILSKIGPHRLTIKFQKHPYAILIVEFKEKDESSSEMDYIFHLIMVKKAGADEGDESFTSSSTSNVGTAKFYLRPVTIIPLDTFAATHGPFTNIDCEINNGNANKLKRKLPPNTEGEKRPKSPAYFVPELAHIVSLCDERLPFALLTIELTAKGIVHGGCVVEANGTCLSVPIFMFPLDLGPGSVPTTTSEKLLQRLHSATMRTQTQLKGFRTWNLELKFAADAKKHMPGAQKPLLFSYPEMSLSPNEENIPKVVDCILNEWFGICKIFHLVHRSKLLRSNDDSLVSIKSFTWNKLVLSYGPNKKAYVILTYLVQDRIYKISFGGAVHNPHTMTRTYLQHLVNASGALTTKGSGGSLDNLIRILNETYEPLYSLSKLPTAPQLGVYLSRPTIPVQTFIVVPVSPLHIRIVYNMIYCLDVHLQSDGLVSIRDGAYSLFDRSSILGELTPTQNLKAFLSKYMDENAMFRRRSQSEDDNPPSPISTVLEMEHNNGTPSTSGVASPFLSSLKPQSPAPGRNNPMTPASPHLQPNSNVPTGFSPASSFVNLSSPPSLSVLQQNSPNPSSHPHMPTPSPSTLLADPSPGGPLSVPTPSPNPGSQQNTGLGHSHASPFFHPDSSPAAQSPWTSVGSPGMPRPSPARIGQSPGNPHFGETVRPNPVVSRIIPQRSWAGAIPTILTRDALDVLCTPVTNIDGAAPSDIPCSPFERFLGCSYLKRHLHRIISSDEHNGHLRILLTTEPGILLFRSETMQFRVFLDVNNFQSLHLKVTSVPEQNKEQYTNEEIQILETFFATKVVAPPFRPNNLASFVKLMTLSPRIIRDCLKIIELQLYPSIVEQHGWKWNVQLCLTVPPFGLPILVLGMPAFVTSASKILVYLNLTRVQSGMHVDESNEDFDKCQSIAVPIIHEINTNSTQLAEKRAMGPPSPEYTTVAAQLKRFSEYNIGVIGSECSLFPSVRDLLMNLNIPFEGGMPPQPLMNPEMRMPMMRMMNPQQQQFGPQHGGMGGPQMM